MSNKQKVRRSLLHVSTLFCLMALTQSAYPAEVDKSSWPSQEELAGVLDASKLMVSGYFAETLESEPSDGVGIPTQLSKMSFSVTRSFKGSASPGDNLIVYVPNEIIEYADSSISRGEYFYFRQEQTSQAKMQLVEKYNFYENEYIEGRLSGAEMKALEEEFTAAYRKLMDSSTSISIDRQPSDLHGRMPRRILIAQQQEYVVGLVERTQGNEVAYSLLPLNQGVYADLDKVLVEKLLLQSEP